MTVNINLLPWREARKEDQRRTYMGYLSFSLIATGCLLLIIHLVVSRWIYGQQKINEYLQTEVKQLDKQIVEIQALAKERKQLLDRMEIIQELQKSRPQVVKIFDGLARIVPDGLYLTNVSRTGQNILIDGRAESNTRVSAFMRNIEGSGWLTAPMLTLIEADDLQKSGQQAKATYDGMIDFHLSAVEVLPGRHEILLDGDTADVSIGGAS